MITRFLAHLLIVFSVVFVVLPEVSGQLADCQNYGTPLNLTDCQCPGFVTGRLCETVKCQRFSVPDKNRCVCPPGWYDKYCGIRGCRPPNEDNLDLQKRSLIIVFNTKTSMKDQLQKLTDSFVSMVAVMTSSWNNNGQTENWIENYIVYGFVQANQKTTITQYISDSVVDTLNFLKNLQLTDGDATQPVLTAVKNAQQTFPKMKSHGIVLVFTDSPASDATPWSHRFTDKNAEQSCLQISLLWRSKVSYLLSLPTGTDMTTDGVDVYRRLSLTNHGDTFYLQNTNETTEVLLNVVGSYFFPENVAVGYGKTGDQMVPTTIDQQYDSIFVLITIDPSTKGPLPTINGGAIFATGTGFIQYVLKNQTDQTIHIFAQSGSVYNYRIYVQSKNTVLFDYNDDMHIDVGNGMAVIGIPMSATMQTYGFPQWTNSSYEVRSADGTLIREKFYSYTRPQQDCTFLYGFPTWNTLTCPSGPITQLHTFYYNGYTKLRVTTGYCIESDHNAEHPNGVTGPVEDSIEQSQDDAITCDQKNVNAVNDPRLNEPRQFVFVLEQHSANQPIYQTLANEISQIVGLVNSTTTGTYKKEFSLIVHDDTASRVLLSSYNPDTFANKFKTFVNSLTYKNNLDSTLGLLSIVQAQKLNIQPTAQVYYFTNQAVKNLQNVSRTWDIVKRDIEVNVFTIADGVTTEIFAMPKQLELVQKMTNGRLIPLTKNEPTLVKIFSDMMTLTALTTDQEQYNCHSSPLILNGYVENGADSAVFQFVGTGIQTIVITDSKGTQVPLNSFISYQNPNFITANIDLKSYARGVWSVSTLVAAGGCQITIRHKTSVGAMLGFTSSRTDDNVSTQIITQRITSNNQPIYIPMRVTSGITPSNLEIQLVNRKRYDQPVSYYNSSVVPRDSASCSYNFVTDHIVIPQNDLTMWILSASDASGNILLHRIFYYYQHFPADTTVCQGNQVDQFGRCICPERFTGDYCWDRICQPAATYSFGICSCPPGFYGDFCEIELIINSNTTVTPFTVPSTVSSIQTTTRVSHLRFNVFSVVLTFSLMFVLL